MRVEEFWKQFNSLVEKARQPEDKLFLKMVRKTLWLLYPQIVGAEDSNTIKALQESIDERYEALAQDRNIKGLPDLPEYDPATSQLFAEWRLRLEEIKQSIAVDENLALFDSIDRLLEYCDEYMGELALRASQHPKSN